MRQRGALKRSWIGAAVGILALLVLATALCCVQQDAVHHHHGVSLDLCSIAILIPLVSLVVGALLLLGLTQTPGRPALAIVPLAVPEPPPRLICLS